MCDLKGHKTIVAGAGWALDELDGVFALATWLEELGNKRGMVSQFGAGDPGAQQFQSGVMGAMAGVDEHE